MDELFELLHHFANLEVEHPRKSGCSFCDTLWGKKDRAQLMIKFNPSNLSATEIVKALR